MEKMKSKVYIGFEDEMICQKYQSLVNYSTNKFGGKPDWITDQMFSNPLCQLCRLSLPLIVQIYAPLDQSQYHRTLYIFGCVNPNCWNKNASWVCLRSQLIDNSTEQREECNDGTVNSYDWCDGADVWEDDGENVTEHVDLINKVDHMSLKEVKLAAVASCVATAEIEEDESQVIAMDMPSTPQTNVTSLLQEVKPVPQGPSESLQFVNFFVSVREEDPNKHVNHLDPSHQITPVIESDCVENGNTTEEYEQSCPPHGDKLFHNFVSRIQRNPGQLIRYIRDGGSPLFLYPETHVPSCCQHCQGELVYELQLLPTLISRLQLIGGGTGHIEFGTVFVLSCKQSCWETGDTFRSEYILVQQER